MPVPKLEIPQRFRRGAAVSEQFERESAAWLIDYMCQRVGLADLGDTELLDMGCGVKFTRLLVNDARPIKRYVGVDVYREMIEFLQNNVDDPRFEYVHINVRNELYNPQGEPFSPDLQLPIQGRFDLICLFSVFTHLPPDDYRTMLEVLRRYVRSDGRLFFSLYIDELTEGGYALMDTVAEWVAANPEMWASKAAVEAEGVRRIEKFRDLDTNRPGRWALYSREYAQELIEESGWRVVTLAPPPSPYIQHSVVCAPC